jgi:hypothetical protein
MHWRPTWAVQVTIPSDGSASFAGYSQYWGGDRPMEKARSVVLCAALEPV